MLVLSVRACMSACVYRGWRWAWRCRNQSLCHLQQPEADKGKEREWRSRKGTYKSGGTKWEARKSWRETEKISERGIEREKERETNNTSAGREQLKPQSHLSQVWAKLGRFDGPFWLISQKPTQLVNWRWSPKHPLHSSVPALADVNTSGEKTERKKKKTGCFRRGNCHAEQNKLDLTASVVTAAQPGMLLLLLLPAAATVRSVGQTTSAPLSSRLEGCSGTKQADNLFGTAEHWSEVHAHRSVAEGSPCLPFIPRNKPSQLVSCWSGCSPSGN